MRVVLQRVSRACVRVDGEVVGQIGAGFVALVGIATGDGEEQVDALAAKTVDLRVFSDAAGKFNPSLRDVGGSVLVVSQFTLLANLRKGRRPSFLGAAAPEQAETLVERYAAALESRGVGVARGRFGASMEVELVNDGPVTIVLDSSALERPRRGGARGDGAAR
jgi:D-tyrosyl-tRNA(Tyr) deacylase